MATWWEHGSNHEKQLPFLARPALILFESFRDSHVEGDISQHFTQLRAAATLPPSHVPRGKLLN